MKARIAALEGSQRRADAHQKSLAKYVRMLENALKDERKKKTGADTKSNEPKNEKENHAVQEQERPPTVPVPSMCPHCGIWVVANLSEIGKKPHNSFLEVQEPGLEDIKEEAKSDREALRAYLDACSSEFTYLMMSPANLPPPRQPSLQQPNLGNLEGRSQTQDAPSRESLEALYLQQAIPKPTKEAARQLPNNKSNAPPFSEFLQSHSESATGAAPMTRMQQVGEDSEVAFVGPPWPTDMQIPGQLEEQKVTKINHVYDENGRPVESEQSPTDLDGKTEADGWDFTDSDASAFPEQEPKPPVASRPDTDVFPPADNIPKSPSRGPGSHRRKGSMSRRRSGDSEQLSLTQSLAQQKTDSSFKVRFGLRGHLDAVRTVIFTGGGSPSEPELCTAGDDGVIKRWIIPARYENHGGILANDLDVQSYFTHRGHSGAVTCLAASYPSPNFSSGGRAQGDGWVFSGGQDATVRVWERGRVDPKATLEGHTDAVWCVCVLPGTVGSIFAASGGAPFGSAPDRIVLVSGAADGTVKVWSCTAPPSLSSTSPLASAQGSGRGGAQGRGGRVRGNSMSSGSGFPTSPQPSVASNSPFHYSLIHTIQRANSDASPTSISPLSPSGENFVVSYSDAAVVVFDTCSGEELVAMASHETYDPSKPFGTGVNAVVASTTGLPDDTGGGSLGGRGYEGGDVGSGHGATGRRGSGQGLMGGMEGGGVLEGIVISGHEDRFIRFFDANSGKFCYFLVFPFWFKLFAVTCSLLLITAQVNAHTTCSPTPPPSRPSPSRPTAGNSSARATTPVSGSGAWRKGPARRRLRPTG
jgi:striatin 1/3/4